MRAEEAISVSNTYTENTVIGMGAIKGAPCTIKSITKSGNLNTVVFEWTDLDNVKHESTMLVYDGADGFSPTIVVKSSTATEYILTITDKNGSYDTPNLKGSGGGGGASAMSDLTDVQLTSLANGQVLVYDGTASKWVNTGLTAADISYDNTTSGLVATKVGAAIDELASEKVDKVTGKGLSENDFTDALKDKLDGVEAAAQVNTIEEVQVNGTALTPDANKAVNVTMELGGLTNVDLNNLQNGHIIIYDAENNKWVNGSQTGTTYTAGDGIEIDQNNVIKSKVVIYTGTKAAWDQLTVAQKIVFTHACWTDDTQSGVVDNVPTQNSDNLVKSGGVWTGLDAKADKTALNDYQTKDLSAPITVDGTQETTVEGAVGAINTLAAGKADPATSLSGYGITDAYTKTETAGAITTEIEKLDVADSAVAGSYVTEVSETDGKISVIREAADAAPTSASNKMVKSGGVYSAVDDVYKTLGDMGAKNLLPFDFYGIVSANNAGTWNGKTYTRNGVSFTVNDDGSILVDSNGQAASADTEFYLASNKSPNSVIMVKNIVSKAVILSGCPEGGASNLWHLRKWGQNSSGTYYDNGSGITFTETAETLGNNNWNIQIRVMNGKTISNQLFKPMLRLATDTDATYKIYAPANKDLLSYEDNAVLGAKNLLYHAGTQTTQGVLFQSDDDGVITVTRQSSSSSHAYYNNGRFTLKPGTYIFSNGYNSLPSGIQATYLYNFTDSAYFKNCNNGPIVFTLTEAKEFAFNIEVQTSQSPSGVKIYPMIRRFTDTDAAYTPFAKTNRQITQELTIEDHWSEAQVTGYTYFSGSYLKKYGKVVSLSFSVSQELAAGTEVKVLELPEGCRPFKNVIVPAYQNGTQYGYAWYKTNGDVTIAPSEAKQWMGFSATFIAGN